MLTEKVKQVLSNQVTDRKALTGKTVASFHAEENLVIVFTDGTWVAFSPDCYFGGEELSINFSVIQPEAAELRRAGLLTEDELKEYQAREDEHWHKMKESQDRAQYERLKAKFEGEQKGDK
jgi:hypothetical protein